MQSLEVTFVSGPVELAGTLTLPDSVRPAPAVILAAGSGHHDRDERICGKAPFLSLAADLGQRGYATLRFDSRGVGASGGTVHDATFDTKVEDLRAAHAFLCADRRIDKHRIFLVGHSEGGLTALACARKTGSPVAMLGSPTLPIETVLHRQAYALSAAGGATPAQLEHERAMNARVFATIREWHADASLLRRTTQVILDALRCWPDAPWDRHHDLAASAAQMAAVVAAPDFRTLLLQDPPTLLASFPYPVAAFFGELDQQVEAAPNLQGFEAATAGHVAAHASVLAGHNHLFQEARTGSPDEYWTLDPTPSAATMRQLARWLDDIGPHMSGYTK